MEIKVLILFHVLGACVWVGGHLVLAISVLPKALKMKNPEAVRIFEDSFERIGIPALMVQIITGLRLAWLYVDISDWFSFDNVMNTHISIKLSLLIVTVLLAVHARFFIIPKLTRDSLSLLALHIIAITIVALALLFTGLNFRLNLI